MLDLIEQHREEINALCRKHDVRRLELFGSAATGKFDPAKSDLDFFVEFLSYDTPTIVDQWFGLQEDLEALFRYRVDLTSLRAAKNPYFLEVANKHKVTLYAAASRLRSTPLTGLWNGRKEIALQGKQHVWQSSDYFSSRAASDSARSSC